MRRAVVYFLAIALAEVVTVALNPVAGAALYTALLLVIILDATIVNRYFECQLVLSLALVPLIRIISLSLPLLSIPQVWWYPAIYLPLMGAAAILAVVLGYRPRDIGLSLKGWPGQLLIGLSGLGLGYAEHLILAPAPLVGELTWQDAWLPALILLICTGFVEELIFRGVLQKSATDSFGIWGIAYISLLFAILHLGWVVGQGAGPLAWLDIPFVLVVALLFGWAVKKTGSLLGVALSQV